MEMHPIRDIYEFATYPTSEEWDSICEPIQDKIGAMKLHVAPWKMEIIETKLINQNYWIVEINNKIFDLINSYVLLFHYYNMKIPDKKEQPFENFQDKHFVILYWFGYYLRHYYLMYFSIIDAVFHFTNIIYGFEVPEKSNFNQKVLEKLNRKNQSLYNYLYKKINYKNPEYFKINRFRNDLVHNYSPDQVGPCVSYDKRKAVYYIGPGKYTTTSEFVENISISIDLLSNILTFFKSNIKLNYDI